MDKSLRETITGGAWLFLGSFVVSVSGLLFWLIVARISGADTIGEASAIYSAAIIAATLVSAGLNLAVIREVAAYGQKAINESIVVSLILAFVASFLTFPLARFLGYNRSLISLASLYAGLNILLLTLLSVLIGLTCFKQYFVVISAGSIVKLVTGTMLSMIGFGVFAPVIGFTTYSITGLLVALIMLLMLGKLRGITKVDKEHLVSLLKLAYSNYPFIIADRLLTTLSVYVFALLVGESLPTGLLYISLMITLAISAIPLSLINAALPIGTKRNSDPFAEGFRIGLSLATPIIVTIIPLSTTILHVVSPELADGAQPLRILLLSIAPLTALTTIINKLNKEQRTRKLALIGTIRLVLLLILLYYLTKGIGITGAALAFLLSNTLTLIPAIKEETHIIKPLAILWLLHILATILAVSVHLPSVTVVAMVLMVSIIVMHITSIYTISDLKDTLHTIRRNLLQRRILND